MEIPETYELLIKYFLFINYKYQVCNGSKKVIEGIIIFHTREKTYLDYTLSYEWFIIWHIEWFFSKLKIFLRPFFLF